MAKQHGLRGSVLETMINQTNEKYEEKGLALVQKIPTPITPLQKDVYKEYQFVLMQKNVQLKVFH